MSAIASQLVSLSFLLIRKVIEQFLAFSESSTFDNSAVIRAQQELYDMIGESLIKQPRPRSFSVLDDNRAVEDIPRPSSLPGAGIEEKSLSSEVSVR
jgi:hypothetical protein